VKKNKILDVAVGENFTVAVHCKKSEKIFSTSIQDFK